MYKIVVLVVFLSVQFVSAEKNYTDFVKHLQQTIQNNSTFKHSAWERLAFIVDTYGSRLWGSINLQQVIAQMKREAEQENFDQVRLQPVINFTKWVRGVQSLVLRSPRPVPTKLDVIGLGGSISGNIQGQVIVVKDYQQLNAQKNNVKGKIVCYNSKWEGYDKSVTYRVQGASKAAQYGAIAVLVRSITSESISSVHTGYMEYNSSVSKIPAAAITVQDAQMFQRMQNRGQKITVHLVLENQFVPNSSSSNLIVEIKGAVYPDQIIVAGGHIDSWDTGPQTGANDDGGGFITVFDAFRLLKRLGYKPKRTLRFIAWSGEQSGSPVDGAAQYHDRHKSELDKHVAAFQSDAGSTQLYGFGHKGQGADILKGILRDYLSIIGAGEYSGDGYSADVEPLFIEGVPVIRNLIKDTENYDYYYKYHHSAGDSMTMMNPDEMDSNVLGIASLLYIIADLDVSLRG